MLPIDKIYKSGKLKNKKLLANKDYDQKVLIKA